MDYSGFFEGSSDYQVVTENSSSFTYLTYNEYGYWEFKVPDWTSMPDEIIISVNPESNLLEEFICKNGWEDCVITQYTIDNAIMGEDGKELTLNLTGNIDDVHKNIKIRKLRG